MWGHGARELAQDVEAVPRRLPGRQRLHHLTRGDRRHVGWVVAGVLDGSVDDGGRVDTKRQCFSVPAWAKIADTESGLAVAGIDRGFAFHRCELEPGRVAAFTGVELGELVAHLDTDLIGTLRELIEEPVGKPGDLGLAVHDRFEHHPEPVADFGAEGGLVEVAEGLLILLQRLSRPTPTTAHQVFAPSPRSPHGYATAGHRRGWWIGGTPPPTTHPSPDATVPRSTEPASSTHTSRSSPRWR